VDYSSRFSTSCTGYECTTIEPTQTSHFPCMRHCYLVVSGEVTQGCDSACHDHGNSFEG
jgi:hypothetical protein